MRVWLRHQSHTLLGHFMMARITLLAILLAPLAVRAAPGALVPEHSMETGDVSPRERGVAASMHDQQHSHDSTYEEHAVISEDALSHKIEQVSAQQMQRIPLTSSDPEDAFNADEHPSNDTDTVATGPY